MPVPNPIPVIDLKSVLQSFIDLAHTFYDWVFGAVDFAVLWRWLPSDIQSAASTLLALLFGFALIQMIRRFLPF